jgi:site-specific recombinase XerD
MLNSTRVSPLRQRFIDHLVLQQKAARTVQAYTAWLYDLAKFTHRSPDLLTPAEVRSWILHLLTQRKLSASSINLAICSLRAFYHDFLQREFEPYVAGVRRPPRLPQLPRVYSVEEIEQLLTIGTDGDLLARVFLMTVYSGGLRLSEATHLQIDDLDSRRHQLRITHAKGGRPRIVPLSDVLLPELRTWYRVHRPVRWLFSQGHDTDPICKGTAQNFFYRAVRRAKLKRCFGIHSLRHSFATHLLESGVEITVVQRLLGHAYLNTTVRYLHVRQERLDEIRSPLGLLKLAAFRDFKAQP